MLTTERACIEFQIVHERRGWSPTLCEFHDVVERRTGWKTHHIFTTTNILATIQYSTEVSSNHWRITIGNRDWGESGDQTVKESKNHWKELAKWTTNFDRRTSGSHVCRGFTTKTHTVSEHIYFTTFHHMSIYKTLDNPSDSSNERSDWEQRRLTDHRNHIVSGLTKQRQMLLVRDREIYPQNLGLSCLSTLFKILSHPLNQKTTSLISLVLPYSFVGPLFLIYLIYYGNFGYANTTSSLLSSIGLVLLILPGVSSISQWSNYVTLGFLDVKNKESSRH